MEFSAAAVAAGAEVAVDEIEERCAGLARRGQFLRGDGTEAWPDGIVAARYGVLYALYQEVTYELSYHLACLAEAYGKAGRPEEGLSILTEAQAVGHKNGECYDEAELYRLKGELTLQQSSV